MSVVDGVSIILACVCVLVVGLSLWGRIQSNKGIGWQFIRFNVIGMALPIICILALNGNVGGEAAVGLVGTIAGYAFGKSDDK
jgi:hypothetical protein